MVAAHNGRSEVVQELLNSKADLDHQDQVSVRTCVCYVRARGIPSIGTIHRSMHTNTFSNRSSTHCITTQPLSQIFNQTQEQNPNLRLSASEHPAHCTSFGLSLS